MDKFLPTFVTTVFLPALVFAQDADVDASAGGATATGTVTILVDSDRDGLLDSQEDVNSNGIVDAGETDPGSPDTDGDGLTDKEEVDAGSDPTVNQFTANPDTVGLQNLGGGVNLASGLRAAWGFDHLAGGAFQDTKPGTPKFHATITGNVTQGGFGTGAVSLPGVFPGAGNYVRMNPDVIDDISNKSKMTFSFWFKHDPVPNNSYMKVLFAHQLFEGQAVAIGYRKTGTGAPLLLLAQDTADITQPSTFQAVSHTVRNPDNSFKPLDDGEWHHVVVSLRVTGQAEVAFFVDGDFTSSYQALGGISFNGTYGLGTNTYLGKLSSGNPVVGMNGSLDQFLLYSRTLSQAEMEALWNYDADGDGVSDREEREIGSNPYLFENDTDNDGLTNDEETAGSASFDGGTTTVNFGATDPGFFDSDGDLFDDYWEAKYFSTGKTDPNNPNLPLKDDPNTPGVIEGDYDNDGLSNYWEMLHGTNPFSNDTDGDGTLDGDEAAYGSNPLDGAEKPLNPEDFYGDENLGSYAPIGDLGVTITASGGSDPTVKAQVGDDSSSHSERWRLIIGDKNLVAPNFGQLSPETEFALDTNDYHTIKLRHVGTDPVYMQTHDEPDLDYTALVSPTKGSPFLLCDPDGLLGAGFQDVDLQEVQYKTAYLIPLDGFSWSESYSGGDAVGPRHRKVALNGRPKPDEKPQQEEESDLPDEETYVDAFNLSLHHDNTFTYLPLASSDLVLQASVSSSETGFTDRSGLLPSERLDLPFGAGWSSSLCSYVEVIENIGGPANDPVSVNVIDEAGRPQRFGTVDFQKFFPWPSTRVDKKTYLNTLERNGEHFVMKKKFGATLVYKKCKAWFLYSSDRQDGSTTMRKHTYWRLVEARDRYGVRLHYTYDEPGTPNEVSLIPHKISSPDRPNQFLVINRTTDHRRVASITDSRGNTTSFNYTTGSFTFAPAPTTGSASVDVPRLDSVDYADNTSTSYTYDGGLEEETDNSDPANTRTTLHYHFNMGSVTDKRGNTHSFSYTFDQSKKYWDSSVNGERVTIDLDRLPQAVRDCVEADLEEKYDTGKGEWKTMYGMSRLVTGVTLPGGIGSSSFSRVGEMKFGSTVEIPVNPETIVTDAEGNVTVYEFTDVSSEIIDVDGTEKSVSAEWMVYYLTSKIHHGAKEGQAGHLGTEIYEFKKEAGLALWRSTDFSGNVTTWEYGNDMPQPLHGVAPTSPLMSKWADPTAKVDALNRREEYSYGAHRVMSEIDDVRGTVTQYTLDGLGRRTADKALEDGTTVLAQSRDDYQNMRFKAFRTRSTVLAYQNLSGHVWEQDLVTQYLPDDRGRLWRTVVDPGGLNLTTENSYDFNNNLTSTIDARGNRIIFEYDKLNRLVKTTYPSAGTRAGEAVTTKEIWYDKNGNKATVIDEEGNYTIYHYDALNRRVKTIRDMDGLGLPTRNADGLVEEANKGSVTGNDIVTEVSFNAVNAPTHAIDANGNVTRTFYDDILRPVHVFSGLTLADAVDLSTATAAAAASTSKTHTEFLYTDSGLVMPGGGGTVKANPGGTAFKSSGFKPTVMIKHDAVNTAGDSSATLTTYAAYDALYRPLRTETEYEPGQYSKTDTAYGAVSNGKEARVSTSTDDRSKVTRTLTDGLGRTLSVTDAYGTPLAATTTTEYTSTGFAWKITDPMGRESESDFDAAGRVIAKWSPDPATGLVNRTTPADIVSGSPVIRTAYDQNSNVTVTVNPLGARHEYVYDARNRKVQELQPEVVSTVILNGIPTQSVLARPTVETFFDGVGNVIAVTDARGNTTRTFYDQAYRVTHILSNPITGTPSSDPQNPGTNDIVVQSVFDPNGNILEDIDANGNVTRNQYDSLNRQVATASNPSDGQPNAPPASPKTTDIVVYSEHDDAGNLVKVTDGEGRITGFRQDGMGRKTRTIWDEGSAVERVEQFTFDGLVQTGRTDAMNRVTTYQYDDRNRLTDILYTGASVDNRHYTYDLVGNQLSVTYPNETASMQTIRGGSMTYDHLNRVLTETSAGVTHNYTFDRANNRITTTYGVTGRKLECQYDRQNRLLSCIEHPSGSQTGRITRYYYDYNSNVTRKVLPNGAEKLATFDALDRRLTDSDLDPQGAYVSSFDYSQPQNGYPSGYDNVGNLVFSVETYGHGSVKDRTVTNTYDKAYRLATETIAETGGSTTLTEYQYGKGNNRLQKSMTVDGGAAVVTTSQYGDTTDGYNSNQLKSASDGTTTTTFTYDSNGNRSEKKVNGVTSQTYSWDHENRLTQLIEAGTGTYTYAYDHRTRRVLRDESQAGGQNEVIVFSGGLSVQEYLSGGSTPQVEYVRGSDYGGGIGGVLYTIRGGNRSYNAYNSRGDVVGKTDDSGAITWQSSYEAFGTRTQEQGSTADRQKANTKDEDPTGLLNEGMRYRDLEFGVFISRDPAGFVDGPNVYTYVRQNPWTGFDPLGLAEEKKSKPYVPKFWSGGVPFVSLNMNVKTTTFESLDKIKPFEPYNKVSHPMSIQPMVLTKKYGIVDVGHVRHNMDRTLDFYKQLSKTVKENGSAPENTMLKTDTNLWGSKILPTRADVEVTAKNIVKVSGSMAYREALQYEKKTDKSSLSYFSVEDLPSNKLGIEIAIEYLKDKELGYEPTEEEWAQSMDKMFLERMKSYDPMSKEEAVEWYRTHGKAYYERTNKGQNMTSDPIPLEDKKK